MVGTAIWMILQKVQQDQILSYCISAICWSFLRQLNIRSQESEVRSQESEESGWLPFFVACSCDFHPTGRCRSGFQTRPAALGIPAKAGIPFDQVVETMICSGFRRDDESFRRHQNFLSSSSSNGMSSSGWISFLPFSEVVAGSLRLEPGLAGSACLAVLRPLVFPDEVG